MRVKGGTVTRQRRKKVLKRASGYYGSKHLLYKTANEQVMRSLHYAYRDRRQVKRDFRKLWIKRINAACHLYGTSYSVFMHALKVNGININRKMLSEMAIHDPDAFKSLVKSVVK
ncbi:MAG: 50S ribosomal protein L20 [Coprobacillus sp.]|nr:50S ribosomal protein L20 [Coprobacillus sp.]